MKHSVKGPEATETQTVSRTRVRVALGVGAAAWLLLLLAGFFAPGGWAWGMPGPVGHMENYVISLWLVSLVIAPIVAARDPDAQRGALLVYLLSVLAILVSTIRGEPPKVISDAPPWVAAMLSVGLVVWAHPRPSSLLRIAPNSHAHSSPAQSVAGAGRGRPGPPLSSGNGPAD
jgi:hypothetical protein